MDANGKALEPVEQSLARALTWWAVGSVVAGAALAAAGSATRRRAVVQFGRQTAMWGAVDGVIAGIGAVTRRRRGPLTAEEAEARARQLRMILLANAVADVGYVVAGAVVAARSRGGRTTWRMGSGDGAAILVQGGFLLVLDVLQARRLDGRAADQLAQ